MQERKKNLYKLKSLGIVEIGNDIWLSNCNYNALIKIDKISGQIRFIDKFPDNNIWKGFLNPNICRIGEQLIFAPELGEKIISYNLNEQKFISIDLEANKIKKGKNHYLSMYPYGQYVYMFPVQADCIIRYDTTNNSIMYLNYHLDELNKSQNKSYYFLNQYEIIDNKLYIPFAEINAVAVFDPDIESLNVEYLDIEGGCSTINYGNGHIYMASWNKPQIYRWNVETGKIKIYTGFPKDFRSKDSYFFSGGHFLNNKLFLFPYHGNMIIMLNLETEEICKIKKIENIDKELCNGYFAKKINGKKYFLTADIESVCCINYKNNNLCFEPVFRLDNVYNQAIIIDYISKHQYSSSVFESTICGLEEYIEILLHVDK